MWHSSSRYEWCKWTHSAYVSIQYLSQICSSAIDHRVWRTEVPVRSPKHKPSADELVVGSVTTSESSLLIVFALIVAAILLSVQRWAVSYLCLEFEWHPRVNKNVVRTFQRIRVKKAMQ